MTVVRLESVVSTGQAFLLVVPSVRITTRSLCRIYIDRVVMRAESWHLDRMSRGNRSVQSTSATTIVGQPNVLSGRGRLAVVEIDRKRREMDRGDLNERADAQMQEAYDSVMSVGSGEERSD